MSGDRPTSGPPGQGKATDPVVDVHAHAWLPDVDEAAASLGQEGLLQQRELELRRNGDASLAASGRMVAERMPRLTDVAVRLADMDAARVDVQIVSPSPSHYHYWADERLAMKIVMLANARMSALIARAPARLAGLGLLPLQHPHLAVAALDHAVKQCGLLGVEISSHAPAREGKPTTELSDPRLEPLWERASELDAIVFLHPFGCTLDERLNRFYLSNVVGQPVENAIALSHLVFSGVLDRHPRLKLIAAHGGGYLPTFLGRADHSWHVRDESRTCARLPSTYMSRLYYDSLVHSPEALRALVRAVGVARVLLGSDYPFDMGVTDPVDRVEAAAFTDDQKHAICAGNARRLGLEPRAPAANRPIPPRQLEE